MTALQAAGVPAGAVLGVADLTTDPHLRARGFWESVSHADAGEWEIEGPAWRLAGNPAAVRLPAPRFGEASPAAAGAGSATGSPTRSARARAAIL